MKTAEQLEEEAKRARRMADIAKHKPISEDDLDKYGMAEKREAFHSQVRLMELAIDLQNAYAAELGNLSKIIETLRLEALYWRQKYRELQAETKKPVG